MQPGMSVSYVARRAGISPSQLFAWKRRMLEGGHAAVQADVRSTRTPGSSSAHHASSCASVPKPNRRLSGETGSTPPIHSDDRPIVDLRCWLGCRSD